MSERLFLVVVVVGITHFEHVRNRAQAQNPKDRIIEP